MKEIILTVKGMVCGGCEKRVETALKNCKGVKKVTADHTSGTVTILAKEQVEENSLKEKIETIGFEIV